MSTDLKKLLMDVSMSNDIEDISKAENLPDESNSIDWSSHFFEPTIGSNYLIKFLPNLDPDNAQNIVHRNYYKLPDPERGGTFQYISKGKGCKVLELFFRLHKLAKEGDPVAEMKIKNFLSNKRQACVKVQILGSPNKEEIGMIRMLRFQTYGENATIANLLDNKLNPSKEILALNPNAKENIFNIFNSSIMSLICKEARYNGLTGRSFSGSSWVDGTTKGAYIKLENGETHIFSKNDLNKDGSYDDKIAPFINELVTTLTSPDLSIYDWFQYKEIGDPRNTKEIDDYLTQLNLKVDKVIDIIENNSISEINTIINGKTVKPSSENTSKSTNIIQESIPKELQNIVTNSEKVSKNVEQKPAKKTNKVADDGDEIDELLDV